MQLLTLGASPGSFGGRGCRNGEVAYESNSPIMVALCNPGAAFTLVYVNGVVAPLSENGQEASRVGRPGPPASLLLRALFDSRHQPPYLG